MDLSLQPKWKFTLVVFCSSCLYLPEGGVYNPCAIFPDYFLFLLFGLRYVRLKATLEDFQDDIQVGNLSPMEIV